MKEFLETLRAIASISVLELGASNGTPQLLIGYRSGANALNVLVEYKNKGAQLSEAQMEFRRRWKGPIITVTDANQVLKCLRRMTTPKE